MNSILITNAHIVNEGKIFPADILIKGNRIERIDAQISSEGVKKVIDAQGKHVFPGVIDDQVHFREPGLTHKANIFTESRAAVAGGVTTFMEMPNTVPNALTQELLQDKYEIAARSSLANYSFFMGASNDNLQEVLKTDPKNVCGIKVFMGSSTGNMLVDDETTLKGLFAEAPMIIATHCEDEATIRKNTAEHRQRFGEEVPIKYHPLIRSEEACYKSSSLAVGLAKEHGAKLHVLHISTAKELELFDNSQPLKDKKITAEACIHHLWFDDRDYEEKGAFIKWNPAVKTEKDKNAIFQAVLDGTIDVIATDHAPHTFEEKSGTYFKAPSGGPLVQHTLVAMLDFYHRGKIKLEEIAEKMSHNPAILFEVKDRGYLREGYYADLAIADLQAPWNVSKENIRAKCGWSPFEGHTFQSSVTHTFISGHLAYEEGELDESQLGQRLLFNR
ncbi:MAG: dihydroorotase [Cytophagales bacterium]|nr:dihydroorotase [Cytophagales bacterium]